MIFNTFPYECEMAIHVFYDRIEEEVLMDTNYGQFISKKFINTLFAITFAFLVVQYINEFTVGNNIIRIITTVLFLIALLITLYFHFVNRAFDYRKGHILKPLQKDMMKRLNFNGKGNVLDAGCHLGAYTIALSKTYKHAMITGVDHDTKLNCEINAKAEKVKKRTTFVEGSLSALGFKDNSFDAVTSCLAFSKAKVNTQGITAALRVLKKGGTFCFVDDFDNPKHYNIEALIADLKKQGYRQVEYIAHLEDEDYVPKYVRTPFVYRHIGMLYGKK